MYRAKVIAKAVSYTPSAVMKAIDLSNGILNFSAYEHLHKIELSEDKQFATSILPSILYLKKEASTLKDKADKIVPNHIVLNETKDVIQFDYEKTLQHILSLNGLSLTLVAK